MKRVGGGVLEETVVFAGVASTAGSGGFRDLGSGFIFLLRKS